MQRYSFRDAEVSAAFERLEIALATFPPLPLEGGGVRKGDAGDFMLMHENEDGSLAFKHSDTRNYLTLAADGTVDAADKGRAFWRGTFGFADPAAPACGRPIGSRELENGERRGCYCGDARESGRLHCWLCAGKAQDIAQAAEEERAGNAAVYVERETAYFSETDCGGVFDGHRVTSDADAGL